MPKAEDKDKAPNSLILFKESNKFKHNKFLSEANAEESNDTPSSPISLLQNSQCKYVRFFSSLNPLESYLIPDSPKLLDTRFSFRVKRL